MRQRRPPRCKLTSLPSVIFISTYQMLIDTYHAHASSAIAANVMVRYCFAGGESGRADKKGHHVVVADSSWSC
jgi:hypothetical protein